LSAHDLVEFATSSAAMAGRAEAAPDLTAFTWPGMAAETAAFYDQLLAGHR
jgi:hypothetical protein